MEFTFENNIPIYIQLLDYMKIYLGAPNLLASAETELNGLKAELATAQKDPTLIELQMKLSEVEKNLSEKKEEMKRQSSEAERLKVQIEGEEDTLKIKESEQKEKTAPTELSRVNDHISSMEEKLNQLVDIVQLDIIDIGRCIARNHGDAELCRLSSRQIEQPHVRDTALLRHLGGIIAIDGIGLDPRGASVQRIFQRIF